MFEFFFRFLFHEAAAPHLTWLQSYTDEASVGMKSLAGYGIVRLTLKFSVPKISVTQMSIC